MDQELIQNKIKRLLNLASNNLNENEAASAIAVATKLAEQYRIEIATLEINGDNTAPAEEVIEDNNPFISGGRIRNWKTILLRAVVKSQGCVHYYRRTGRSHQATTHYYVFGRPSDIAIARNMLVWAIAELEFIGMRICQGKGKRYANAWYNGAVDAISQGLRKGKEKAREGCSTTALTIVDSRVKKSAATMTQTYKLVTKKRTSTSLDSKGYDDGYHVGSKMTISGGNKILK